MANGQITTKKYVNKLRVADVQLGSTDALFNRINQLTHVVVSS